MFAAMAGLPITIRLLDPPLHEFLPKEAELVHAIDRARLDQSADLDELEQTLERTRQIQETNPMLGTRGCRLGIVYPEIYEMQVRALMRAARTVRDGSGDPPHLEIMIPLVDYEQEIEIMRALVVRIASEEEHARERRLHRRHDDRAAARLLRRRPDRAARRLLLASAPTTSPRPRSASPATTPKAASSPPTSTARSSTPARSRRSTSPASAGSSASPPGSAARPAPTSSSASAASTAATPSPSRSSTPPGSTTSPAPPTASRSPASPPPRPRSPTSRSSAAAVFVEERGMSSATVSG